GDQTEGALLLFEAYMPRGKATPLHVHPKADETFYVLEGEIMTHVDGAEGVARQGALVQIPRGAAHAFVVRSETVRMIVMFTPADSVSEAFFREAGERAHAAALPPSAQPDLELLQRAAGRTGLKILGPPPFVAPTVNAVG